MQAKYADMEFDWDPTKAAKNLRKHYVSFEEASTSLRDTLSITGGDPEHSEDESRWIPFGISDKGRLLVASHTEEGETIRIISARVATNTVRKMCEEG